MLGLRSKTAWERLGRRLVVGAVPAGHVSRQEGTAVGVGVHPVVRELGRGRYVVALDWYEVYGLDQTEAVDGSPTTTVVTVEEYKAEWESRKTSGDIRSSSDTPTPIYSFVAPSEAKTASKSLKDKGLTTKKNRDTSPPKKSAVNNDSWAYVPSGLTADDRAKLGADVELAYCVMHLIHYWRVRQALPKDAYIDMSRDYCRERLGGKQGANWDRTRSLMLESGIMERTDTHDITDDYGLGVSVSTPRGVEGNRAYGYRLRADLRHSTFRRTPLTDPRAIRASRPNVSGYTLRWLKRNLMRITIVPVPDDVLRAIAEADTDGTGTVEDRVDAYRETIRWIDEGAWQFEPDGFSGRVHTNITNLKRELRPYLRVDGKPLCAVDIPCSQLAFIGLAAKAAERQHRKQFVDDDFFATWERDIYQHLADGLSLDRKTVKQQLTQAGLFASNRSDHQKTAVMRRFKAQVPLIAEDIRATKNYKPKATDPQETKDKPYRVLAQKAQTYERQYVIDTVCDRLRRERPDMFATTIHDSVLMSRDDAEFVRLVMLDEFSKHNLNPTLKVEDYAKDQ